MHPQEKRVMTVDVPQQICLNSHGLRRGITLVDNSSLSLLKYVNNLSNM